MPKVLSYSIHPLPRPASLISIALLLFGAGMPSRARAEGFGPYTSYATGSQPHGLAVGDLNGDGHPDLVIANLAFNSGNSTITVLLGAGDGTFGSRVDYPASMWPRAIALTDLNGDGHLDYVAACTSGWVSARLGDGDGGFGSRLDMRITSANSANLMSLAVADFNRDGKPDVAVTDENAAAVDILLGTGTGTFTKSSVPLSGGAGIVAADVDHDGKPDLAVASIHDGVVILPGLGNGGFGATIPVLSGDWWALAFGDLNGDGNLDLFVDSEVNDNGVVLLGQDGSFGFTQGATFSAGQSSGNPAIADFDGDGRLDLAIPSGPNNLAIFFNQGNAQFDQGTFTHTACAGYTAAADLDGDGKPDLAILCGSSGVQVMLNEYGAPHVPVPFTGFFSHAPAQLHWPRNRESDFASYGLYRGATADFVPAPDNLIATTPDTGYVDGSSSWSYYKLASTDQTGHTSDYAPLTPGGTFSTESLFGSDVTAQLGPDVTVTFDKVDNRGTTTLVTHPDGPPPPDGMQVVPGAPPLYDALSTTANWSGSAAVCVTYDPSRVTTSESNLLLMHYDTTLNPPAWVPITTTRDSGAHMLCGKTSHPSEFAVMERLLPLGVGNGATPALALTSFPNPVAGPTSIRFALPGAAGIRLGVYDVQGRLVRELLRGPLPAGVHEATWDGRDSGGGRPGTGVYFVRLEMNGARQERRIVRLQ